MAETEVGSVVYTVKLDWSKALQSAPGMGANLQAALNRQNGSGVVGGSPGVASSGIIFSPMAGSAGNANMPRGGTAWGGGGFIGGPTQVYGGAGGGGGGGGGPGFPGGGAGDDDRVGRSFFNRFVFVAGLREAGRIASAERDYSIASGLAGNNQRQQLTATLGLRKALGEGAFGIGQLASFANDPNGYGQLGVDRAIQSADSTDAATKSAIQYGNYRNSLGREAGASGLFGADRRRAEAENDFQSAKEDSIDRNRAATAAQRTQILDSERSKSQGAFNAAVVASDAGKTPLQRLIAAGARSLKRDDINAGIEASAQANAADAISKIKDDTAENEARLKIIHDNRLRDIDRGETISLGRIAGEDDDRRSGERTTELGMRAALVGNRRVGAKITASASYLDAFNRFMRNPGSVSNINNLSRTYDQANLENQVIDRESNVREGIALNSSRGLGKQLDAVIANRLVKADAIGIGTAGVNRLIADKDANQGKLYAQDERNTTKEFEELKVNFLRSLRGGEVSSSQLGGGTSEIGKTLDEIQQALVQFKADVVSILNSVFN